MNEANEMINLKWHFQTWGHPISHCHWLTLILALPLFLYKFFLYIHMCVCVCVCVCVCLFCVELLSHVRLFAIPWTVACQAPLSVGLSNNTGVGAISYSRGSSQPRHQTCISCISYIGKRILYHSTTWEALSISYLNWNDWISPSIFGEKFRASKVPKSLQVWECLPIALIRGK